MPPKNGVGRHEGRDSAQQPAAQAVAEFREAPTLVVLKTQPPSFKTDLQHTILFAEKRDHVLVFTLSPSAQHRYHSRASASEQEQQSRLFEVARTNPAWLFACVAATLSFYCGLRACEIKALRWQDVELGSRLLHVRRSKTRAGWRAPTLNATCLDVLQELHDTSAKLGFTQPTHFVFPWHGRNKQLDPTKAMTSWRSAWRSLRKTAGLSEVRFHDGRHTAITTLAEKGLPDWVIQAQVGHVAPEMMKTYSHIRRQALNQAADALEPTAAPNSVPPAPPAVSPRAANTPRKGVMSHGTSQNDRGRSRILDFPRKVGSPPWTLFDTGSFMQLECSSSPYLVER